LRNHEDSYVAVLAIDKSLTFIRKGHDITREDVLAALTNDRRENKPNITGVEKSFDLTNKIFVLNVDLENWGECTEEEKKIFTKNFPGVVVRDAEGVGFGKNAEVPARRGKKGEMKYDKKGLRDWFPETWVCETIYFDKKSVDNKTLSLTVPDTMTTWLFTAFSVNKRKGFGLAEPRELLVTQKFFVELSTPNTLRLGENVKLDLIVFNYIDEKAENYRGTIKIFSKINDKTHFKFVKVISAGATCNKEDLDGTELELDEYDFNINAGTEIVDERLNIEPLHNGPSFIVVEVEMRIGSKTYKDTVQKEIEVINQGVAAFSTETFPFRHDQYKSNTLTSPINVQNVSAKSIEITAVISSQIAGPVINFEGKR
jgi:hypothetical protein